MTPEPLRMDEGSTPDGSGALDPTSDDDLEGVTDDGFSEDDFNYDAPTIDVHENSYLVLPFQRLKSPTPENKELHTEVRHAHLGSNPLTRVSKGRPQLPRSLRDLGVIIESRRREKVQQTNRGAATAWIDRDDSGTYHPTADRATPPASPARRGRRARSESNSDEESGAGPREPGKYRRKVGRGLPMTFRFKSEKGRDYLRSITPGPQTQEDEVEQHSDSGYWSLPHRRIKRPDRLGETSTRIDGLTLVDLAIGHPQRRGCKACFLAGDDGCSLLHDAFDYPCTACDDASIDCEFIVLPRLKKVCENCKRKRIRCSYREDGGEGVDTCKACEDDGVPCCAGQLQGSLRSTRYDEVGLKPSRGELYTQNRQHIACNECRLTGLRCNLRSKSQPGPCKNCDENDQDCTFTLVLDEAVSPKSKAWKSSTKRKLQETKSSKDSYRQSTPERGGKATTWQSTPPNLARSIGKEWLSQREGRRMLKRSSLGKPERATPQKPLQPRTNIQSSAVTANKSFPLLGTTNSIKHIVISTSFSHPISFNHVPSPMHNVPPCTFCSVPLFGLFGHGSVNVEIIPYARENGHGNEEMSGGHSDKHLPTKICRACTYQRVTILGCKIHELKEIEDVQAVKTCGTEIMDRDGANTNLSQKSNDADVKAQLLGAALLALDKGDHEGGKFAIETKWCAICPSPATHHCCTSQPVKTDPGCGLILCAQCAILYGKVEAGMKGISGFVGPGDGKNKVFSAAQILDRTIKEVGTKSWGYDLGVRADSEFLRLDGELVLRMKKGFGAGVNPKKASDKGKRKWTENDKGNERTKPATTKGRTDPESDCERDPGSVNERVPHASHAQSKSSKRPLPLTRHTPPSLRLLSDSDFDSDDNPRPRPSNTKRRRITKRAKSEEIADPILAQVLMTGKGPLNGGICGPFAVKQSGKRAAGKAEQGRADIAVSGKVKPRGNHSTRGSRGGTRGNASRGRGITNGRGRGRGRGRPRGSVVGREAENSRPKTAKNSESKAMTPQKKKKTPARSKEVIDISSSSNDSSSSDDVDEPIDSSSYSECGEVVSMETY